MPLVLTTYYIQFSLFGLKHIPCFSHTIHGVKYTNLQLTDKQCGHVHTNTNRTMPRYQRV
jgi:hypothetical protein